MTPETLPFGLPLLTLSWSIPLLAAAGISRLPRGGWGLALATQSLQGALALALLVAHHRLGGSVDLGERLTVGALNYHLRVDGINVLFLPVIASLGLMITLYGWQAQKAQPARWQATVLSLQAALTGLVLSADLFLFGAFLLAEIPPARALIRTWGTGERREEAAQRFTSFMLLSAALWFAGALAVVTLAAPQVGWSSDLGDLLQASLSGRGAHLTFLLLFWAMAIRLPLFPVHAWMPSVIAEGPVVGLNVSLLGVKVGALGLMRFVLPLLPEAVARSAGWVTALALVGLAWGALAALAQTNFRRLIAYATLAHMGLVVPGLFSLNVHGLEGALLQTLNLGVVAAGLYFVAGFFYLRTGSSQLGRWRRSANALPLLGLLFLVLALAGLGMPGTGGFDATHLILEGLLGGHHYAAAAGVGLGTIACAVSLLSYYQRVFLTGGADPEAPALPDLGRRELAIAGTVAGLLLLLGVYSHPWLEEVHPSVEALSHRYHADTSHP